MARKTIVTLTDDLVGGPATQTIRFGLHSVDYEIDLNDENAEELTQWLDNYISHGRRVGGRKKTGAPKSGVSTDASAVRVWAKEQGIPVSERGRIPADLSARFLAETA